MQETTSNYNLACTKKQHDNGSRESASLLEGHGPQPQLHQTRIRKTSGVLRPTNLNLQSEGPHVQTLGGPAPSKYNRFEQLLKTLVGRKVSKESATTGMTPTSATTATVAAPPSTNPTITTAPSPLFQNQNTPLLISSPEIRISKSPSEHNLLRGDRPPTTSTTSLNSVQQRLWNVMPLLRREGSCTSLQPDKANPVVHHTGMKKCETVLALSHSSNNLEPIKPLNRLRNSASVATCSRCSSLLSLAANGSRYSLNLAHGGFIPIGGPNIADKTSLLRASTHSSITPSGSAAPVANVAATCKLCLADVQPDKLTQLTQCGCEFCTEVSCSPS